jgi:hypothetical protein
MEVHKMKSRWTLSILLAMVLAISMFATTSCQAASPEASPTESSAVTTEVSPATTTDVSPAANTAISSEKEEETNTVESANIEPVTTLYGRREIDKSAAMAYYRMIESFTEGEYPSFVIIKDCSTTVPEVPVTDDPMSYIEEVDDEKTNLALDVMGMLGDSVFDNEIGGQEIDPAVWAKSIEEFGFIIRYPKGKEDITGHASDLFRLRYVGSPELARKISEAGSLEEYLNSK